MFIIVFFLFTIYLNYSVDGNTLNVDRWSALENGAKALINGDYPYNFLSHMQHKSSNLPMLMILGLPFYLIFGSVGYLQSFCFLLFAFLIYKMFKSYKERLLILLLIVLSPSYVYEVYTKSDMMSNFIILLLGMYLILRNLEQKSAKKIMILGLFSSMLFLTRISSVIPLLLVLFYPFISFSLKNKLIFIISSLTTSIIILYIGFHNANNFSEIVKNNPFTVQATRQPLYITLSFVILSVLLSFRIKVKSQYYSFSGLLLFMMIFIFFIITSSWHKSCMTVEAKSSPALAGTKIMEPTTTLFNSGTKVASLDSSSEVTTLMLRRPSLRARIRTFLAKGQ